MKQRAYGFWDDIIERLAKPGSDVWVYGLRVLLNGEVGGDGGRDGERGGIVCKEMLIPGLVLIILRSMRKLHRRGHGPWTRRRCSG